MACLLARSDAAVYIAGWRGFAAAHSDEFL
jgi:hypothetical protein